MTLAKTRSNLRFYKSRKLKTNKTKLDFSMSGDKILPFCYFKDFNNNSNKFHLQKKKKYNYNEYGANQTVELIELMSVG